MIGLCGGGGGCCCSMESIGLSLLLLLDTDMASKMFRINKNILYLRIQTRIVSQ